MAGLELDFVRDAALDIEFPREKDLPNDARRRRAGLDDGGQKLDIFALTGRPIPPSFPRKRESGAPAWSMALDPRFRGDDEREQHRESHMAMRREPQNPFELY